MFRSGTQVSRNNGEGGWSGGFVTYFLLFTLFVVVGYLVLHNKNKVGGVFSLRLLCAHVDEKTESKESGRCVFSSGDSFRCWVY